MTKGPYEYLGSPILSPVINTNFAIDVVLNLATPSDSGSNTTAVSPLNDLVPLSCSINNSPS